MESNLHNRFRKNDDLETLKKKNLTHAHTHTCACRLAGLAACMANQFGYSSCTSLFLHLATGGHSGKATLRIFQGRGCLNI